MGTFAQVRGALVAALLSDGTRHARERVRTWARAARGAPRQLIFFWQALDPYSHLLAEALPRLLSAVPLDVELVVVPPAGPEFDPEPPLRQRFGLRDAGEVAPHFRLSFPRGARVPTEAVVAAAERILLMRARPQSEQLELARVVGRALWTDDAAALASLAAAHGSVEESDRARLRTEGAQREHVLGHYQGGMLHYEGQWYGGVDRVHTLLARLAAEGLTIDAAAVWPPLDRPYASAGETPAPPSVAPIFHVARGHAHPRGDRGRIRPRLEVFFSFRSPYSYLALSRTKHLELSYPIDVELRPVLPMVARGMQVSRLKRRYLLEDAKREATRLGLPFGRICDPLGVGVERCFAAFEHARSQGRGFEFVQSVMRGIWSEARDPTSDADMRFVCERAGLPWKPARRALDEASWRATAERNASALRETGLWGVPTFRVDGWSTWGQDRIPLVERRIRADLGWP